MKKVFVLISILVISYFLPGCKSENATQPEQVIQDTTHFITDTSIHIDSIKEGSLTIYKLNKFQTVIVKIPEISSYIYLKKPTRTLSGVGIDSNFALVVNSSYFDYMPADTVTHQSDYYYHAGYFKMHDSVYQIMKDERQASNLFAYNSRTKTVNYFTLNELGLTSGYDLVVQAGPMLIKNNQVDSSHISASVNGLLPWPRTLFASVNGKDLYIIVNLNFTPASLFEMAKLLRECGLFKPTLNVMNFDGGVSTALYIRNHPELCTRSETTLPFMIGVK
ncbi:MAG: phosphodiester glycosidase family protein [Ignavibacteria bacterium]|nr:phosphodiester glycosidase family protein [Ignavibacteria bacterium]